MPHKVISLPILSAILFAQAPPQQVIRVTTRLVEVNAIVRDKGKVVPGLAADDFVLLDNGKPQKIAVFSTSSAGASGKAPVPLPPNVFTNIPGLRAETPNNVTVVLLDGLNTHAFDQAYTRAQFLKFLQQLHPEDRVAVYALGRKLVVLNDFTSDARRLLAAVQRYRGENLGSVDASDPNSPDYGSTPPDNSGKLADGGYAILLAMLQEAQQNAADFATLSAAEITAAALEAIAANLATVPGRKSLVWITGGLPLQIDQAMRLNKAQSADRDLMGEPTYRAMKALNDAGIAVYPVDARGLILGPVASAPKGQTTVREAMRGGPSVSSMSVSASHDPFVALARVTGGQAFYNGNDIQTAIRKAVDDSEFTYTLGFYPDSSDLDSTFHEIKLRVKDKNYEVRCRNGYRAIPQEAATDPQREKLLRDALWSPIPASGLDLVVRLEKVYGPEPGASHLALSVASKSLTLESKDGRWADTVDYVAAQRSSDGRILNRKAKGIALNLDQEQYRRTQSEGIAFSDIAEPLPGAVEIRVVLLERATGKIGSVTVPLRR